MAKDEGGLKGAVKRLQGRLLLLLGTVLDDGLGVLQIVSVLFVLLLKWGIHTSMKTSHSSPYQKA